MKLDSGFPESEFKIEGYQYPLLRRDKISKKGSETFAFNFLE